jgi:hypothetical protein
MTIIVLVEIDLVIFWRAINTNAAQTAVCVTMIYRNVFVCGLTQTLLLIGSYVMGLEKKQISVIYMYHKK